MTTTTTTIWDISAEFGKDPQADAHILNDLLLLLAEALQGDDDELICHLSREIVLAIPLSDCVELWDETVEAAVVVAIGTDNENETITIEGAALGLLDAAAAATVGTDHEENCSDRRDDFETLMSALRSDLRDWPLVECLVKSKRTGSKVKAEE